MTAPSLTRRGRKSLEEEMMELPVEHESDLSVAAINPPQTGHHLIIRNIVPTLQSNHTDHFSVDEVDAYIQSWQAKGWKVINVMLLEHTRDGDVFAWILVR